MSTPEVIPSKAKTWVGTATAFLAFLVPLVLSVQDYLPAPWPAVIGGVLVVLTGLGIYKAPYRPAGTVLVPDSPAVTEAVAGDVPPDGTFTNPWR